MTTGTFVISLDLELNWGMFDAVAPGSYEDNIRGVHKVTPKLLDLFTTYDVAATWAIVGMLQYQDLATLQSCSPETQPHYREHWRSTYEHAATEKPANQPDLYFAPDLVKQIAATKHQEIASHTFSHYYCAEEHLSPMAEAWAADCKAERTVIKHTTGHTPTSLVFPRNQWTNEALDIAKAHDITAFRGTESHWLYQPRQQGSQRSPWLRLGRIIDSYLNLSGHHTHLPTIIAGLVNIPASRFLRPYSPHLRYLERLRLRRITRSMTKAAKRGEVFHLWWHPHNFGVRQEENLAFLESILQHYQTLAATYGMQSLTMQQVATATNGSAVATNVAD